MTPKSNPSTSSRRMLNAVICVGILTVIAIIPIAFKLRGKTVTERADVSFSLISDPPFLEADYIPRKAVFDAVIKRVVSNSRMSAESVDLVSRSRTQDDEASPESLRLTVRMAFEVIGNLNKTAYFHVQVVSSWSALAPEFHGIANVTDIRDIVIEDAPWPVAIWEPPAPIRGPVPIGYNPPVGVPPEPAIWQVPEPPDLPLPIPANPPKGVAVEPPIPPSSVDVSVRTFPIPPPVEVDTEPPPSTGRGGLGPIGETHESPPIEYLVGDVEARKRH